MHLDDKNKVMLRMLTADRKPTLREMGAAVKLTIGGVQHRVNALIWHQYIERVPGMARGLVLTEKGRLALMEEGGQ